MQIEELGKLSLPKQVITPPPQKKKFGQIKIKKSIR